MAGKSVGDRRGRHRVKPVREPYRWLGAGVVTLGVGAAVVGGAGSAQADDGGESSGASSSGSVSPAGSTDSAPSGASAPHGRSTQGGAPDGPVDSIPPIGVTETTTTGGGTTGSTTVSVGGAPEVVINAQTTTATGTTTTGTATTGTIAPTSSEPTSTQSTTAVPTVSVPVRGSSTLDPPPVLATVPARSPDPTGTVAAVGNSSQVDANTRPVGPTQTSTGQVSAARMLVAAHVDPTIANSLQASTFSAALVTPTVPAPTAAPAPTLIDTVLALPGTIISTALNLITQALAPLIGPGAPADNPMLWAALAFVRRQFNESFANSAPALAPRQTSEGLDDGQVHGTFGATDADGDALTYTVPTTGLGAPVHGTVAVDQATGTWTYTPDAGYIGADSFYVTTSDESTGPHVHALGQTHLATALVDVRVDAAAVNTAPTLTAEPGDTVPGTGAIRYTVTTHDSPGDTVTVSVTTPPAHGTLTQDVTDPTIYVYKPDPVYAHSLALDGATASGSDNITFTATDSKGLTGTVTVTPAIAPSNTAPTLTVLTEATDAPNGALKVTITYADADADILTATVGTLEHGSLYTDPTGGTPSLTGTTTTPGPVDPAATIVGYYIADPARPGVDTLSVTLSDAYGGTVIRTQALTGTAPVNQNPTGVVEAGDPDENGVVLISVKVKDPEGDPVTVFYPDPDTGTLEYLNEEDHDDGSFTQFYRYTPYAQSRVDASHTPGIDTDTLAFDISDTDDDTSDYTTITTDVTISPLAAITVNHAPTVTLTTTPTGAADGSLYVTVTVGEQDADVDTQTLSDPVHGTYVIDGQTLTTGFTSPAVPFGPTEQSTTFVYVPDRTRPGTETITFSITDADGETATASQQVVVTAAPPSFTVTNHDTTTGIVTGTVTATDPQGRPLTYTVDTTQTNGSVTVNATTGAWTYTPTATALAQSYTDGGTRTASFVINATNTTGEAVTVTVTVPVNVTTASLASMLQRQGSTPSAVAVGPNGVLYVTNSGANTLSVIDPTTNTITNTVHVGASPTAVSVGADGRVWVTNGAENTVTVLSHTGATIDTTIGVGSAPTGLAFGADGSVFVANAGDGTISVINATTNTLDRTITIGGTPIGIAAGADGRIYVTDFTGNAIKVIDPTRGDALTTIDKAGANPFGIAVSSAGTVYVTHPLNNTVSVLTLAAGNYTSRTVAVGTSPTAIALGTNGSIYVTDTGAGTVTVIDPHTFTTASIATGTNPNSITVGPDGNLYVTNGGSDSLSIVNSQNGSVTSVSVGVDPHTVTVDTHGNLSVASNYDDTVSVINHPTTGAVVTGTVITGTVSTGTVTNVNVTDTGFNINTGAGTGSVGLSPDGRYAYVLNVVNYGSGTVTVFNPATGTATTFNTGSRPTDVVFSPDSRYAYVTSTAGSVSILDPVTGTATTINTGVITGNVDGTHSVVVSPDGRYAYVTNTAGAVLIINPVAGTATTFNNVAYLFPVVVTPDSRYAYVTSGASVSIFDSVAGTATTIKTGAPITSAGRVVVSPDGRTAYVYTFGGGNTVSVINPATGTASTIDTGTYLAPVVVSPDSRYAYVTSVDGTVTVIRAATGSSTTVNVGDAPGGLVVSPDSRYAYVTNYAGTVSIIDPVTGTATTVAGAHGNALVVSPDSRYAYAYNYLDTVSVINPAIGTATTLDVGVGADTIQVSPDGRYAYAYCYDCASPTTTVTVIDPVTGTGTTIKVGLGDGGLKVSPDSRYAYVNNGVGTVSIIDPVTGTATSTGSYPYANRLVVSPDSRYAYGYDAYNGNGTVGIIDPVTGTATMIGRAGTGGVVVVSPDSRYAYTYSAIYNPATNSYDYAVTVINPAIGTATTVPTSTKPNFAVVSPDSRYAYVTNTGNGIVTVIDTRKLTFPSGSIAPSYRANTYADSPVTFDPTANPFMPGTGVTITGVSAPTNGIAVLNGSRITYTPNAGYTGTDTFTYTATNGASSGTGTIAVQVNTVYESVPDEAGPTGTQDLYSTLRDAMDGVDGKTLEHGVYTQHVLVNGRESLIVYIAGTMNGLIGGDQALIKNIPAASGIVDEDQVAVIKAAMSDANESILLVGYSQGGMDAQNIAANAAAYGLQDQIKAVITYGSPLVQIDKYPTVHLEDFADTVPKFNLLTPTNWIAGIVNSAINKNVYGASSLNDFDTSVLTNFSTWGVHGVRSTYEDVGLKYDVDTSSHWDGVRNAMASFLNGRVVPDGYTVLDETIVPAQSPTQF
jgi:YVTN family beta-propeller protein/VCBS repeat-containing protein